MRPQMGIVLTGGGARAAYQAGVLKGIDEILGSSAGTHPFRVITGVSAGSINASFLAASDEAFSSRVNTLSDLWTNLTPDKVIQTRTTSFIGNAFRWLKDLSMGGLLGGQKVTNLLDATPLSGHLTKWIDFKRIRANLKKDALSSLAVTCTSYSTGISLTFYDSERPVEPWYRSGRAGIREPIEVNHIIGSAAIPFLFAPIQIGKGFYGDGAIRSNTPLSPAIHLGAEKILAIGVRRMRSQDETLELIQHQGKGAISLAEIAGVTLNSLFLDALDSDVERLQRINGTLKLLSEEARRSHPLRALPILVIRPSVDLGSLAAGAFEKLPGLMRHLLKGLGVSSKNSSDFLSYLAFDRAYTEQLISIGRKDALARSAEILEFFTTP